ncbi:S41 family peptidase [Pseudomarimonas arenosa]|uniref:Tail specific protease domain-containing protein n=1 Tax=Pseudomarimonas arenosa TaxID=2774145 RepID=A0AAW3ZTC3_9GAMM|nr:S41 family peptidase [Pseudomarimonas arenosa]MBD8528257.1 hypothetical protein [Pseudomarimonas arenosa]
MPLIITRLIFLICLALLASFSSISYAAEHRLQLAARAWGLAKYHHPNITRCQLDWDAVMMERVVLLEADDAAARAEAIMSMLAAAGDGSRQPVDEQTPAWIVDSNLPPALQEQLAWLAAQRPSQQCYVSTESWGGPAQFSRDVGQAVFDPDRRQRALALFRFWNAIEYFFPYKADIGRDWGELFDQYADRIIDAPSRADYVLAMREFTAAIEDSHAFFFEAASAPGEGLAPFTLTSIDGRDIVLQVLPNAATVRPGDELLAIDGESLVDRKRRLQAQVFGSNPITKEREALRLALSLGANPGRFSLQRPDGSRYEVSLPRSGLYHFSTLAGQPVWQSRALDGCRIGIVDLARLQPAEVMPMLAAMQSNDAIVFDVRNYPNNTMWPIVDVLYAEPTLMAHLSQPDLAAPGRFTLFENRLGGRQPSGWQGRILLLQDERTQSQAEFSLMGFEATGRTISFGSQTAGADGNITSIELPGTLTSYFTGLGVFYPDGRATQRIGIVPDVHVRPTIAGLAAGRDEVLEAALDCRWLQDAAPSRLPASGAYYAPARNGEGLDVHADGQTTAVLSYGYDAHGEPEWLLAASLSDSEAWQSSFLRYTDGGDAHQAAPDYGVDFERGPYHRVCADKNQNALHPRAQWRWPGSADSEGNCQQPLLLNSGPAGGLWSGPPPELGWGLSIHQQNEQLSVFVYAYDDAGQPRWLLGTGTLDDAGQASITLQRFGGFCRHCPPTDLSVTEAGTLELDLRGALHNVEQGNWLSINAQFGAGHSRWQRQNMPMQRLVGH